MQNSGRFILLIFVLIPFHNSVFACVPAISIKYIVKHRLENFDSDLDISEPVRISKEDLESFFNSDERSGFRIRNREENTAPEEVETTDKPVKTTEKPTSSRSDK